MAPNSGVQEYCLRWNNHHSTLVSVMDSLLQKGALVDVTLAAEGKSIQVHRLVLFACSHYFQVRKKKKASQPHFLTNQMSNVSYFE